MKIIHFSNVITERPTRVLVKPVTDEQVFYDKFLCDTRALGK